MDTFRADDLLETIREDHELVAEHLAILDELQKSPSLGSEEHLERALKLLHQVAIFARTKLIPHMESEEGGLFLLLREFLPRGSTLVYELESEHEQLRNMCDRLCEEIELLRHKRHQRAELFAELQSLCGRIGELLKQHAEREDNLVQNYLKARARTEPLNAVSS